MPAVFAQQAFFYNSLAIRLLLVYALVVSLWTCLAAEWALLCSWLRTCLCSLCHILRSCVPSCLEL